MPRYTHQACNIEELIQISPYAVICLFRFTLSLLGFFIFCQNRLKDNLTFRQIKG